jgi:hypothetical protein
MRETQDPLNHSATPRALAREITGNAGVLLNPTLLRSAKFDWSASRYQAFWGFVEQGSTGRQGARQVSGATTSSREIFEISSDRDTINTSTTFGHIACPQVPCPRSQHVDHTHAVPLPNEDIAAIISTGKCATNTAHALALKCHS